MHVLCGNVEGDRVLDRRRAHSTRCIASRPGSCSPFASVTWGTTWFAITFQIGHVPPEVGVALRFALAGGTILMLCLLRGEKLGFSAGQARDLRPARQLHVRHFVRVRVPRRTNTSCPAWWRWAIRRRRSSQASERAPCSGRRSRGGGSCSVASPGIAGVALIFWAALPGDRQGSRQHVAGRTVHRSDSVSCYPRWAASPRVATRRAACRSAPALRLRHALPAPPSLPCSPLPRDRPSCRPPSGHGGLSLAVPGAGRFGR